MIDPTPINRDEALKLFRRRIIRLNRTSLARLLRKRGLVVDIYKRPDGSFEVVLPKVTDDALDAFLLNYRVLTQKKDRISVYSIADLLNTLEVPTVVKDRFHRIRNALNAHLEARPLVSLACMETNRVLIDVVLYGLFAHSDPAKYTLASTWISARGEEEIRLCFVSALDKAMTHITKAGAAVGTICRIIRRA